VRFQISNRPIRQGIKERHKSPTSQNAKLLRATSSDTLSYNFQLAHRHCGGDPFLLMGLKVLTRVLIMSAFSTFPFIGPEGKKHPEAMSVC
jgi:hypothetical protein